MLNKGRVRASWISVAMHYHHSSPFFWPKSWYALGPSSTTCNDLNRQNGWQLKLRGQCRPLQRSSTCFVLVGNCCTVKICGHIWGTKLVGRGISLSQKTGIAHQSSSCGWFWNREITPWPDENWHKKEDELIDVLTVADSMNLPERAIESFSMLKRHDVSSV